MNSFIQRMYTTVLVFLAATTINATAAWRDEGGNLISTDECQNKGIDHVSDQVLLALTTPLLPNTSGGDLTSIARVADIALRESLIGLGATAIRPVFPDIGTPSKGDPIPSVDLSRFFAIEFAYAIDVRSVCDYLAKFSTVLFAEPNYIIPDPELLEVQRSNPSIRRSYWPNARSSDGWVRGFPQTPPSDVEWASQWNLQDDGPGIGCPTAWEITTGDPDIRLGSVDKGIKSDHYDLNVVDGRKYYVDLLGHPTEAALSGTGAAHATFSAGVMCALTDNERGVAGIAGGAYPQSGCSLIDIQMEYDNNSPFTTELHAYATMRAADSRRLNCDVISYSLNFPCYSETWRAAIAYCYGVGVNVVAAKSNYGESTFGIPADLDHSWVTAVGAYGPNGLYCNVDSSNCSFTSNYGLGIDLLAPGESCLTTSIFTNPSYEDTLLGLYGGTSGSTPHVAGALGLLRSYYQNSLRPEDYESILKFSSRDPNHMGSDGDPLTWDERYGYGCLEIGAALEAADGGSLVYYSVEGGTGYAYTDTLGDFEFVSGPYMSGYKIIPYKVEASIDFEDTFEMAPPVWGTRPFPYTTYGFSGADPNYGTPFSGVYDSTVTADGCVVWTFVYKVHDANGSFVAWYPESPDDVPIGCRVLAPQGKRRSILTDAVKMQVAGAVAIDNNVISLEVPSLIHVSINIYDVRGRLIRRLHDGEVGGAIRLSWDGMTDSGRRAETGVYIVKYQVGDKRTTQKLLRVR